MAKIAFAPDQVTALPVATAAAFAWRARGQLQVTVLVKATFVFTPGRRDEVLGAAGGPVRGGVSEVYHRGGQGRMVRFASDWAEREDDNLEMTHAVREHGAAHGRARLERASERASSAGVALGVSSACLRMAKTFVTLGTVMLPNGALNRLPAVSDDSVAAGRKLEEHAGERGEDRRSKRPGGVQ